VVICGSKAAGRDQGVEANEKDNGPEIYWASDWYREHLPAVVLVLHPGSRPYNYADDPDGTPRVDPTGLLDEMEAVVNAFREREDVNQRRVVVTGFGQGGTSAWLLVVRNPFVYAGAAPVDGRPPLRLPEVERIRSVPLWMAVGNRNPWHGSWHYLATWRLLRESDHPDVRFWEVQDIGSEAALAATLPMAQWLYGREQPMLP
jgi:predicted peptidase